MLEMELGDNTLMVRRRYINIMNDFSYRLVSTTVPGMLLIVGQC
jgi:hypothetical protein